MTQNSYFRDTFQPVWGSVQAKPPESRVLVINNLARYLEQAHGNIDAPLVHWAGELLRAWPTKEGSGYPELRTAIKNLVLCLDKQGHGNALIDVLSPVTEREAWFHGVLVPPAPSRICGSLSTGPNISPRGSARA